MKMPTWLNANTFHNACSLLLLIVGALGAFDWTSLGATSTQAVHIVGDIAMVTSILKLGVNAQRDGLAGMVAPQPPVTTASPPAKT